MLSDVLFEADVWEALPELKQELGHEWAAKAWWQGDSECAAGRAADVGYFFVQGAQLSYKGRSSARQYLAGLSQPKAASGPLDQRFADALFEPSETSGYGGAWHIE